MKLTIITTGGTIDKIYFDAKSAYQVGDPQIGDILLAFNVAVEFEIVSLLRKDSLELTDEDRQSIYNAVDSSDNTRFVITHGTDTMIETARVLEPLGESNAVVLTGALNPARFLGSDATFNIGCAVSAAQCKRNGIFLAMNGRIWDPKRVRKNRELNRFEPID
ncbi:MAG: asparaginase domain-containing protein [Planctomycetota bacterium]